MCTRHLAAGVTGRCSGRVAGDDGRRRRRLRLRLRHRRWRSALRSRRTAYQASRAGGCARTRPWPANRRRTLRT